VNRLFNDGTHSQAQIDAQLAELAGTGATVARSDALWESGEPAAPIGGVHRYDWSFDDRIAASLAAHRLRWLPIIDYTAVWDESVAGQDHSPPSSTADYAAFAGAFAARYGPGGAFWRAHPGPSAEPVTSFEIWNEPDTGQFWVTGPNPAAYARLYLAARAAIDVADPTARVIVGGLTEPTSFLPEMVRTMPDLAGHVDGVAIHPYGAPLAVLRRVRAARATLDSLGMGGVPLYVTEFGWATDPPGAISYAPESRRPGYIADALTGLGHIGCGLAGVLLYTWVTPEQNLADREDWFGISSPSGDPNADVAAFALGLLDATLPAPPARSPIPGSWWRAAPCAGSAPAPAPQP
jgi:hypothetical protein